MESWDPNFSLPYFTVAHVINPSAYEDQTNLKPGLHKNYDDEIRGEEAERSMFNECPSNAFQSNQR